VRPAAAGDRSATAAADGDAVTGGWVEFTTVAFAHLLAVASPGPDFALVLKQSVVHGRRAAVWASVGIGTGILLHVGYSLFGLGLLIRGSTTWFNVVKFAGATYLAWVGLQCLRAKPRNDGATDDPAAAAPMGPSDRGAFATGFLTNALNPKATLFFISLFAMVVDPHTPKLVQAGYGLWMTLVTAAWFCLVSVLFTQPMVRGRFLRASHWIDRALGVVFLGFAAWLAVAEMR
jgi:RhtB (resistance to homoserine/threonine) family protein